MDKLIQDISLADNAQKIKTAKALWKGAAREILVTILNCLTVLQGVNEEVNKNVFKEALEQLGRLYFASNHAHCYQRNYLRYHIFMMDMGYKAFQDELLRQNMYLKYFPVPDDRKSCHSLPEDKLVKIVDQAKRIKWQRYLSLPPAWISTVYHWIPTANI